MTDSFEEKAFKRIDCTRAATLVYYLFLWAKTFRGYHPPQLSKNKI